MHNLNSTQNQTPRGQEFLGHIEEWKIKMMAVFFFLPQPSSCSQSLYYSKLQSSLSIINIIANTKGFKFHAQPNPYSCSIARGRGIWSLKKNTQKWNSWHELIASYPHNLNFSSQQPERRMKHPTFSTLSCILISFYDIYRQKLSASFFTTPSLPSFSSSPAPVVTFLVK